MTKVPQNARRRTPPAQVPPGGCWWCGGPLDHQLAGRPRRYCRQSCRQRAYEARKVDRVREWLAYRESELTAIQADVDLVTEMCEPHSGDVRTTPRERALARSVLATVAPYFGSVRHGRLRPPPHPHPGPPQWADPARRGRRPDFSAYEALDALLARY